MSEGSTLSCYRHNIGILPFCRENIYGHGDEETIAGERDMGFRSEVLWEFVKVLGMDAFLGKLHVAIFSLISFWALDRPMRRAAEELRRRSEDLLKESPLIYIYNVSDRTLNISVLVVFVNCIL